MMPPPRVVVVGDVPATLVRELQSRDFNGEIRLVQVPVGIPGTLKEVLAPHIREAVALILARPTQLRQTITDDTITGAPVGLLILPVSAGRDHIKVLRPDVQVIGAQGNEESVAELNVHLALTLLRPIHLAAADVHRGNFSNIAYAESSLLRGRKWLVVGSGRQVPHLITRLTGFGIGDLIVQNPRMDSGRLKACIDQAAGFTASSQLVEEPDGDVICEMKSPQFTIRGTRSLARAVSVADIISLHVPGSPQTNHLIDSKLLDVFKPQAILINTARGEVVDEEAVCDALKSARLRGYGADVIGTEAERTSDPSQSPIWSLSNTRKFNIVLLPHIGGTTAEAMQGLADSVSQSLADRLGLRRVSAG